LTGGGFLGLFVFFFGGGFWVFMILWFFVFFCCSENRAMPRDLCYNWGKKTIYSMVRGSSDDEERRKKRGTGESSEGEGGRPL